MSVACPMCASSVNNDEVYMCDGDVGCTAHWTARSPCCVYDLITAAVGYAGGRPTEENVRTVLLFFNLFFLDGLGGSGKTELIFAYKRCQSKIVLATASSAIAALLLTGYKTVHSTFYLHSLGNIHRMQNGGEDAFDIG